MGNRKAAEAWFLTFIKELEAIIGTSNNSKLYAEFLGAMSDKSFDKMMHSIRAGDLTLPFFSENMGDGTVPSRKVRDYAEKKLGVEWFQRLTITDAVTGDTHITPVSYLVMDLPVRRLAQHIFKKISLPESTKIVDHLSGQATGASKGSTVSFPELGVLNDRGLHNTITELVKARGGDEIAFNAMMEQVENNGGFSVKAIEELGSQPKAVETLQLLLLACHIDSNL